MSEETSVADAETPLAETDPVHIFWQESSKWPLDTLTHIFLAEAVDLLGKSRFGEAWVALSDPTLPEAHVQRGVVFREFRDALESGELKTFTRPVEGGPKEPIDRSIWNVDRFRNRFKYCRVDRDDPFDYLGDPEAGSYIYLDRSELEAFIRSLPTRRLRIDDADSLPALLAVLVRTAAVLELKFDSSPLPSKTIDAKFQQLASQAGIDPRHTRALGRYAATFLRPPGAGRTEQQKISSVDFSRSEKYTAHQIPSINQVHR